MEPNSSNADLKNLRICHMNRGFSIPYTGKAEHGYSGFTSQEQKRADSWEKPSNYWRYVHQERGGIINKRQTNLKDAGESVKTDIGEDQKKDVFCCSGLRRRSGAHVSLVDMSHLLPVPVQDRNHGAAGADHEPHT